MRESVAIPASIRNCTSIVTREEGAAEGFRAPRIARLTDLSNDVDKDASAPRGRQNSDFGLFSMDARRFPERIAS